MADAETLRPLADLFASMNGWLSNSDGLMIEDVIDWRNQLAHALHTSTCGVFSAMSWTDRCTCAEELAAALASSGSPTEPEIEKAYQRAYDRLQLCPDHRDKVNGRCIVCMAEERTRQEGASSGSASTPDPRPATDEEVRASAARMLAKHKPSFERLAAGSASLPKTEIQR